MLYLDYEVAFIDNLTVMSQPCSLYHFVSNERVLPKNPLFSVAYLL